MYFKMVYENGYCGCQEEEYVELKDELEADTYLHNSIPLYGFFDPDSRFVDEDDYDCEEDYFEAVESYQDAIYDYSYFEEVTKEEYEENQ